VLRLVVVVAACLSLSSCVAEMVTKTPPRKGPVKEVGFIQTGGGEVRFSTDGWGWVIALRRGEAHRRMRRLCGKELKVKVVDEFTHEDVEATYSSDDMVELSKGVNHFEVAPYHHIVFDCVDSTGAPKQ